jgi:hypothetical protein
MSIDMSKAVSSNRAEPTYRFQRVHPALITGHVLMVKAQRADLCRALADWRHSPWCFVASGRIRDLRTMINSCCDAIAQHQQHRNLTTAIVVLRGDSHRLQLQHCAAVSRAIHGALGPRTTNLWFAAVRDPVLVDALRVTVVTDK